MLKPAVRPHFFALAGPHKASCTICHTAGKLTRYTCYGCHDYQPVQIRADHAVEGILNIENCTRCHRSASENGDGDE